MELKRDLYKMVLVCMTTAVLLISTSASNAAGPPASPTTEQEMLEQKETDEQPVQSEPIVMPTEVQEAIAQLPEDTTPRYTIDELQLTGNTLFTKDELLRDMPAVYNASPAGALDTEMLYDLRPLQEIYSQPDTSRQVSARSIQGLTQYILSVYRKHQYAGIYVYVPAGAFEPGAELERGILPVRVLEAPVSNVSYNYYEPNNVPKQKSYLSPAVMQKWSPVKEGQVANRKKLDDFLNLLNLNPDRYVSAMFTRGSEADSLAVSYNVYEANPWHYFIQVDNSGTKDIQWHPRIGVINTNLLGFDDKFTAVYQGAPDSTWDDEYAVFGGYDFPIWGPKLRMNLFAGYNKFAITDPDINFLGSGTFAGGTLRYNAFQRDDWFLDLTGTLQYEESKITPSLFPQFFASNVRLVLWGWGAELYKTTDMTDTLFGYNMLTPLDTSELSEIQTARQNAVDNFHIHYFNARHSRYLDAGKVQRVTASVRVIVPDDRLVPSKMTSFGGMYTVRGYDESEIVADGGVIASAQYEYDLVRKNQVEFFGADISDEDRKPYLKKLAPLLFADYGNARIQDPITANGETTDRELCSVGCGLITELGDNITGSVYYGYPLIPTEDTRSGKGRVNAGFLIRW